MTGLVRAAFLALVLFAGLRAAVSAATLRVCSDPDYMPFSNRAGAGFENKIAAAVAKALGDTLAYTWQTTRGAGGYDQFLHQTLDAHKCDVVMDIPYAADGVSATQPYYISSYVFVFPKSKHYDISSMDSPALRDLRIGYETDTPAADGLKIRALTPHSVPFDTSEAGTSPAAILDALKSGRISVALTWEPAIGYFLRSRPDLEVVSVPNSRSQGTPEQYAFPMAMAARSGDSATRDRLDAVISRHKGELTSILAQYGVRLYKPTDAGV